MVISYQSSMTGNGEGVPNQ